MIMIMIMIIIHFTHSGNKSWFLSMVPWTLTTCTFFLLDIPVLSASDNRCKFFDKQ